MFFVRTIPSLGEDGSQWNGDSIVYGCVRLPTRKCDTFQADKFVPCPIPQIAKISFAIYQSWIPPKQAQTTWNFYLFPAADWDW